jgi:ligand-binding SRPBCC domain-containing protein
MMPTFDYSFTVDAPKAEVAAFHSDTGALKILTPPPIVVQLHHYEPLGEGSTAYFTLWFGPLPVHWKAVHTDVGEDGFTDTQVRGPLRRWRHTHRFSAVSDGVTLVSEHIDYEYDAGIKGLLSRLMYSKASLYLFFTARKLITRKKIGERHV